METLEEEVQVAVQQRFVSATENRMVFLCEKRALSSDVRERKRLRKRVSDMVLTFNVLHIHSFFVMMHLEVAFYKKFQRTNFCVRVSTGKQTEDMQDQVLFFSKNASHQALHAFLRKIETFEIRE